jgi:hypothetical protein
MKSFETFERYDGYVIGSCRIIRYILFVFSW